MEPSIPVSLRLQFRQMCQPDRASIYLYLYGAFMVALNTALVEQMQPFRSYCYEILRLLRAAQLDQSRRRTFLCRSILNYRYANAAFVSGHHCSPMLK